MGLCVFKRGTRVAKFFQKDVGKMDEMQSRFLSGWMLTVGKAIVVWIDGGWKLTAKRLAVCKEVVT